MTATAVESSGQPGGSAGESETTEVTPEQLRSMPMENLVELLDREGIEVPDHIDVTDQDAVVDWVISEFAA